MTDDTIAGSEHKNQQAGITEMKSALLFEQIALQASRPEILERINAYIYVEKFSLIAVCLHGSV